MFHETDHQVAAWIAERGIRSQIRFDLPDQPRSSRMLIWVHLHGIRRDSHGGVDRRLDLAFLVRYLLVPTASDPRRAHRLLGELAVVAAETDGVQWDDDPDPAIWQGRDCPMLPGIAIAVPACWRRDTPLAPPVTEVAIARAPRGDFLGLVLGPDERPMPGEPVLLPQLKTRTVTGRDGRFHFPGIPLAPGRELLVQVRQRRWRVAPQSDPTTLTYRPQEA